jgi:hypothetical protein
VGGSLAGRTGTEYDEVETHRRMVPERGASGALAARLVQQDRGRD